MSFPLQEYIVMHKYKVINFSGVPYGKPAEMQKGREQYIVRQLVKTDDIWHPKLNNKYQEVFKVIPLGHQQLKVLHTLLMRASNTPLDAFHCEQVIGRVLRILNRPRSPDMHQMISYNANLDETLKLAHNLSRYGVNWRKIGRVLMNFALCAAVASGVAFFLVSSPASFAMAGAAAFLGSVAWFLKIFSVANLEETLSGFVGNAKRFVPSHKNTFNFDNHYYFSDGSNVPPPNGPFYDIKRIRDTLNEYLPQSLVLPQFQSNTSYFHDVSYREVLAVSLQSRVIEGDDFNELLQQLNDIPTCSDIDHFKYVAAICGLTMILDENHTFSMIETSALYELTHLDPLGSDNPAEALQQAAVEFHKNRIKSCEEVKEKTKENTLVQQAYQTLSGFFGSTKSQSNSVNTSVEIPQQEVPQLCMAYC